MKKTLIKAPDFEIQKWLNTNEPISIENLKGRIIVAFAFQMLCPGCVENSIPQARRIHAMFSPDEVAVIGLHTVFEHHAAMGEESLKAFLHEYQIDFPVGIDMPSGEESDPIPKTMRAYSMQGTPTLILIDQKGNLRKQKFGHEPDLSMGAELMALVLERKN